MYPLSRLQLRSTFLLGVLAGLGLLINLGILATGARAGDDTTNAPTVDPVGQRRTLERLNEEIASLKQSQFPTVTEAQEKAFELFSLAQEHDVTIRSLVNSDPQPQTLGSTDFTTMVSRVEVRGQRSNIIKMLLKLQDVFGEAMLLSNVSVSGTAEDWVIQFILTQYIRSS